MAEATTPLAATIDAFDHARGVDMDGVWAWAVAWALLTRDVDAGQVRDGMQEALALVRETQESPTDLFGSSHEHANSLYERWSSEDHLVLTTPDVHSWRWALERGLALSAAYALVFLVLFQVRDGATTENVLRFGAISMVIGLGTTIGLTAWSRRHRRSRHLTATTPPEAQWSAALTEILRTRYSLPGGRVHSIVAEAHAHAAEAGRSVHEEFGTPEEYAARFTPDHAHKRRFEAALWGLLGVSTGIWLLDDFGWFRAVVSAACLALAVRTWRRTD